MHRRLAASGTYYTRISTKHRFPLDPDENEVIQDFTDEVIDDIEWFDGI